MPFSLRRPAPSSSSSSSRPPPPAEPAGWLVRLCAHPATRPVLSTEVLLLVVCLYFTLFCNMAFWRALVAGREGLGAMVAYGLPLAVALTAVQVLLLAPWLNRWTTRPLLALLVVVASSAAYFGSRFGVYFDPSMLRNVVRTDVAEASELLTVRFALHLLVFAVLPLVLIARVRIRPRPLGRAVAVRAAWMLGGLVLALGALVPVFKDFASQMRNNKEIRYLLLPAAVVWSAGRVLVQDAQVATGPRQVIAPDARLGARASQAGKPVLMVVVVGETARAANWGLNRAQGWPQARDTTPALAARGDVINFPDVRSCGTNTEVSVPCMFSLQGRRNYDEDAIRRSESLLHVLRRAGLRVVWNDNQSGCKGVCDGLESLQPDAAQYPQLCTGGRCLDGALLDSSQRLVRDASGNLVLVMHQLGNHGPSYFRRHPPQFRRFLPTCENDDLARCTREQIANSYDNALLYTDHVLAQTIEWLVQLQSRFDTAMIYVSDHGESLGERGLYLHGVPYAIAPDEQTRVPMVMWFSPGFAARSGLNTECLRQQASRPASHDNLFHTLLGLLDVETTARERSLDLSAPCRS